MILKELMAKYLKDGFKSLEKEEVNELKSNIDLINDVEFKTAFEKDIAGSEEDEEVEETKNLIKDFVGKEVEKRFSNYDESIKAEIKSFIAEQKELMAKKAGAYQPEVKEQKEFCNKYFRGLAKSLLMNDNTILKEMTTDATGSPYSGYTVDSQLSAEIRSLVTEYGVARKEMSTIQLTKNSYKANELITDVIVYWVAEGNAISSGQIVLGQNELELKKLGAIVCLTNELIADEEIDLFGYISRRVAQGFAKAEDEACFIGDGTATYGKFTGLLNSSSVNTVTMAGTTFASMDADDLLDMITASPQAVRGTGKFYMNFGILNLIRKLKTTDGVYIYQEPSENGPATIWGRPVVIVEVMPNISDSASNTPFVIFGDLKQGCIFGFKGGIEAMKFDSGLIKDVAGTGTINLITEDRQAIRLTERFGYIQVITTLDKPITVLKTAVESV